MKMRAVVQHWVYSGLVFASGLFVGVVHAQALHNPETQLPRENAGFLMPQQLADLTLAEVGDLMPVLAPALVPIYGVNVILRYPTKPTSLAVRVATISICTYVRGEPPMTYAYAVRNVRSGKVPQAYTTIKSEAQLEENMMGVIKARTRKACPLPREYRPVNWYHDPWT